MSQKNVLERLIANAEERLEQSKQNADGIRKEIAELKKRLRLERDADEQLPLPLNRGTRGLSDKWALVLSFMVFRAPNPVSIDDIFAFASSSDLEISRSGLRAQLHNYEKRGLIERVSDGLYLTTAAARAYCEY